jgi:hypothetical protein
MTTVFAVFMLGLFVSLVVAKGVMQAREFAEQELKKQDDEANES